MNAPRPPQVFVRDGAALAREALSELITTVREQPRALVSFATGRSFARFFADLGAGLGSGKVPAEDWVATHLDEYLGFAPDDPGGMAHELFTACPVLRDWHERGRFVAVPGTGDETSLRAHERRLAELGGVALQFAGVGRNGHLAFNEPGTSFELGFHRAELSPVTREDARARFAVAGAKEPPREAVTAGPRNVLEAKSLVVIAMGMAKAAAVQAMLDGPIDPACPASIVRRHPQALILLDPEAASKLARRAHSE